MAVIASVLTPLGPNPAALTELLWELTRRGYAIRSVHVVLESARAVGYWRLEVGDPGGAYDALRAQRGDALPPRDAIDARVACFPGGGVPRDARVEGVVEAMREPLWAAARDAQSAAGDAPVIFALSGGRWRASTALTTTVFQLLARPRDRLVDVRVSDPVAEGGTGFFFPSQPQQALGGVGKRRRRGFQARDIAIRLEPVDVPRLRGLLTEPELGSFGAALAASQRRLAAHRIPRRLAIDLTAGRASVEGEPLRLSKDRFALYALLAARAASGDPWVGAMDESAIAGSLAVAKALPGCRWVGGLRAEVLQRLRDRSGGAVLDLRRQQLLSQLWSKTRAQVADACVRAGLPGQEWIVPEHATVAGESRWRIRLPRERVVIALGSGR